MLAATRDLVRWLDELGRVSDERGRLTRTFLSPAMRRANARVAGWMRAAGLRVREDAVGNVIGRLEPGNAGSTNERRRSNGAVPRSRPAKTLVLGSHLDTVRDAGRFDGALGVLLPIAALRELRRRGVELPFAIEVVGFSEEEGVRFGSAYFGSKGYTGQLTAADLRLRDADGMTVRAALETHHRGSFTLPNAAHREDELIGYAEVHIEQGPVLEQKKLAVGVVSAIAGQTRGRMIFRGKAGHAGTTPMDLRRDALAGAAEFVSFAEALARASAPLVATVGALTVAPGIGNVIAGEATLSLDVRHPRDASRRAALRLLLDGARAIARRRRLALAWEKTQDHGAVECAPRLTAELEASVRAVQRRSVSLVSGAGHDAVVMSAMASLAMLFVRCRDGLSHHPDEHASAADIDVAVRVMVDFLQRLTQAGAPLAGARERRRAPPRR